MTLNSSLVPLANAVRNLTFNDRKLSIDEMAKALTYWNLFKAEFPTIDTDNGLQSIKDGNSQKFTFSGSFSHNVYIHDWGYIQRWITSGTEVEQALTVETDGTLNHLILHNYNSGKGNQEDTISQYFAKLTSNKYRIYLDSKNKISSVIEPFNFDINISNGTYVKFSELYFNMVGYYTQGGGIIKLMLLYLQSDFNDWRYAI